MMKRGGRSYDSTGINGTSPGELAVVCPACPLPSINLPPNWESVGKDLGYANALSSFSFPNPILLSYLSLGAEGVLPGRHIESFLRVFKQFTLKLPRG